MEWPSKNVPHGGILHPAKCSYSPETRNYIKVLMDEAKLTMMQRNKVNYYLRNGEPLPSLASTTRRSNPRIPEITIRPGSSKKRSQETIKKSGAYEREKFVSNVPSIDRQKQIEKLQNKMAYNAEIKINEKKLFRNLEPKETKEDINRFDQLVQEIKERENWLKEMEDLGQGNKYREIINLQIQEKVREMKNMKLQDYTDQNLES